MDFSEVSANELARLCSAPENVEAWQEFRRRFRRYIVLAVSRVARGYGERPSETCDDLAQQTYLRICRDGCKLLRDFRPQYEDSIVALVQDVATKTAHDHFRSNSRQKRSRRTRLELEDIDLAAVANAGSAVDQIDRHVLFGEIVQLLNSLVRSTALGNRDEEIFLLHFRQGFTLSEIAAMPGFRLGVRGVEASLRRSRAMLRWALRPRQIQDRPRN
jgi:RNA polymerase sigma-70 factor (ECF subfamily)